MPSTGGAAIRGQNTAPVTQLRQAVFIDHATGCHEYILPIIAWSTDYTAYISNQMLVLDEIAWDEHRGPIRRAWDVEGHFTGIIKDGRRLPTTVDPDRHA